MEMQAKGGSDLTRGTIIKTIVFEQNPEAGPAIRNRLLATQLQ